MMWWVGSSLEDIAGWCERHRYDVSPLAARWDWVGTPEGKYYGCLPALASLLGARHCTEVGSGYGASSSALAMSGSRVTTWDVRSDWIPDPSVLGPRVEMRILREPKACVEIDFSRSDLLFIDIGTHEGRYERQIHERLSRRHCGVVVWDDIAWQGMRPLWRDIGEPKLAVDWHGGGGMGLVYYGWPGRLRRWNSDNLSAADIMPNYWR